MSPRTWAARVQAAFAARTPAKPPRGKELARQAIVVLVGLCGTGVLLYLFFVAPLPGAGPATPAPGATAATRPAAAATPTAHGAADAAARDLHTSGQAQPPPVSQAPAPPAPGTLLPPVTGNVLAPFGWTYSPALADWRLHGGVSLAATAGAAVHAAAAGTVTSVADDPLWGETVLVGDGGGVSTEYASLATVRVQPGQRLAAGQVLGSAGDTAAIEADLGPHVYFAVLESGRAVDPLPLLQRP